MKCDDIEICCDCGCEIPYYEIEWAEGDKIFCKECAKELKECDYCGDLRYPENLVEYDDKGSKWHGKKMCIGCIEKAEEEEE